MPKLAPSPALPVDADSRQQSTVIPSPAPVPERGPEINRNEERTRLSANRATTSPSPNAQQESPQLPDASHTPQLPGAPVSVPSRAMTPPEERAPTTVESAPPHTQALPTLHDREQRDQKIGLLERTLKQLSTLGEYLSFSELAAKVVGLMNPHVTKLSGWLGFHAKPLVRESLNIKPPPETSYREEWRPVTETTIVSPLEDDSLLTHDTPQKPSLTQEALTAVATATQSKIEEAEKKQASIESETRRSKEGAQATLRRLQLEGLSPGELAEISAELTGVYGTAEVALRTARDLLTRKKPS